jgi:hypothetical protein
MLFLAVFCGFLAEYQLEHKIEKDREKQFMKSLFEDLKTDTTKLQVAITSFIEQDKYFDTLFNLFPLLTKGYNHSLRNSMIGVMGWKSFIATDKTIQQLKYSGGMRLIRKSNVADEIGEYDALVRANDLEIQEFEQSIDKVDDNLGQIVNMRALETAMQTKSIAELERGNENFLLKEDEEILGQYYNRLKIYRLLRGFALDRIKELKSSATNLIALLKKEYHLKD